MTVFVSVRTKPTPISKLRYFRTLPSRRGQQEAAMCDEVVVADIKGRHAFQEKQTVGVNQSNYKMHPCPTDYIYPVNWQLQQAANFAKLRQSYIKRHKASERHKTKSKVAFPVSMTLDHWCKFCFGTEFFERFPPGL